jgi:hypothetical protein
MKACLVSQKANRMKIKEIIQEEADAVATSSGNIAVVQSNLFAKPIKRAENKSYGNTPKPAKYIPKAK